jgi:hypothetical protein
MVEVPAGVFMRGFDVCRPDEAPALPITLSPSPR